MERLVSDEDVELILHDLYEIYGYDFLQYSRASLKRRIVRLMQLDHSPSIAEFRYLVKSDANYLRRFVEELTVNVTEMFRDPNFYKTLREHVFPVLATYPLIRIWHAGCSTGEEVYSTSIVLHEMGLLKKSIIYATDLNPGVLETARKGVMPLSQMKQYSENYLQSGGKEEFSKYYSAVYDKAKITDMLRSKVVFATHNLVSDHSFNEFQLILCRNVMIYFDKNLQDKVIKLFDESLEQLGFLALGAKETLRFSSLSPKYRQLENKEKIWRKIA